MKIVNMHQAKTHLSRLVEEAVSGVDIVIGKAGKPMVRLVPVVSLQGPRVPDVLAGQVHEIDPDWWGPDPELEALFYGWSETDPLGADVDREKDGG